MRTDPIVIRTKRLILRPFREDDWSAVHEYAVDPEISRYQDWGPNGVEDTKSFVQKCMNAQETGYYFSITLPEEDRHIGGCRLALSTKKRSEASIGYTISRAYWCNGYATEAAEALLRFAFEDLSLHRVTADCDSTNVGSWRVMEKIGMLLVSTDLNAKFFKGYWRDWLEYAITEQQWRSRF